MQTATNYQLLRYVLQKNKFYQKWLAQEEVTRFFKLQRKQSNEVYNFMQKVKDYFYLEQTEPIIGGCKEFISQDELQWKDINILECEPFKRVGSYIRNIQYTSNNTRTLDTLKDVLNYLIEFIFPLMFKPNKLGISAERVALFLEERLVAIRCEYFVQAIIYPKELLKLFRCLIVVWMIKGIGKSSFDLIGLQFLVQQESKTIMEAQFPKEYQQALRYSIFNTKRSELTKLLSIHEAILENQELARLLALRLKIQRNNYQAYFNSISQENASLRCLIWLKIQDIKTQFTKIVKKSFGDVRRSWLCKYLCVVNTKAQAQVWISSKNIAQVSECKGLGFTEWIKLQTLQSVLA